MKEKLSEEERMKLELEICDREYEKKLAEDEYRSKYYKESQKLFLRYMKLNERTDILFPFIGYYRENYKEIVLKKISEEEVIKHVFPDMPYGPESIEKLEQLYTDMYDFFEIQYHLDTYGNLDEYYLERLGPKPPPIILPVIF